jgi:hypothetical protein
VLSQAAEKTKELSLDFELGRKDAGELVEELAKAIPVYGDIISAGRTFRGLIDGTTIATAKLNEENKKTNDILESQQQMLDDIRQSRERTLIIENGGESDADQIKRGATKKTDAIDAAAAKRRREIDADLAKARLDAADTAEGRDTGYGKFGAVSTPKSAAEREAARARVAELENARNQLERTRKADVDQVNRERDAMLKQNQREREDARRQFGRTCSAGRRTSKG